MNETFRKYIVPAVLPGDASAADGSHTETPLMHVNYFQSVKRRRLCDR